MEISKKILFLSAVILLSVGVFGIFSLTTKKNTQLDDVNIDDKITLKETGYNFSGKLEIIDGSNHTLINVKEGLPFGEWIDTYKGSLIHKGNYFESEEIKAFCKSKYKFKSLVLDHWQEGELTSGEHPPFLSVIMVMDSSDLGALDETSFNRVEETFLKISNKLTDIKYNYILLHFSDKIIFPTKNFEIEFNVSTREIKFDKY